MRRGIVKSWSAGSRGCRLSTLVRIDGAASVAERAFDLLAPAALSTVAAKTTEHMIEDIVAMSGFMTFWACQFPIAVAVRACGLRHDRCSFPASLYGYGNEPHRSTPASVALALRATADLID